MLCSTKTISRRVLSSSWPSVTPTIRRDYLKPYLQSRYLATAINEKKEGDISSVFASLSGKKEPVLPESFIQLKHHLLGNNTDKVEQSWHRLVDSISTGVKDIKELKHNSIPTIDFLDLAACPQEAKDYIKKRGVVVVRGVFEKDEALALKRDVQQYIKENASITKSFPKDNPQVYEIYWSRSQTKARLDRRMTEMTKFLQRLWTTSNEADAQGLITPQVYADRLRIRTPGDASFRLGPHVDGGSLERWEDREYSNCYKKIFEGDWENYNPFDATHRLNAKQDLYNGGGACSVFRQFQGWLSLSSCNPGEGTLRVNPLLKETTAYLMLRPFFSPSSSTSTNLKNWKMDLSTSKFHGAGQGVAQEFTEDLNGHPHLQLADSMVSIPKIEPGDYVAWHCDTIHAVDFVHSGKQDSSVFYIPVVPKTSANDTYLERQRNAFIEGVPPPDFPGGAGEKNHKGRATVDTIREDGDDMALHALGFA